MLNSLIFYRQWNIYWTHDYFRVIFNYCLKIISTYFLRYSVISACSLGICFSSSPRSTSVAAISLRASFKIFVYHRELWKFFHHFIKRWSVAMNWKENNLNALSNEYINHNVLLSLWRYISINLSVAFISSI